ncbi:GQ68_03566T0 [Komagataella phaffii GS115]|nr:GQ68_03566T0 [Komagataella phaffii GS115]
MSISTKNSVNSEHDPLQQPTSSSNYQTIPETTPKSLPPDREERRPLLSPDDPSVSPLNVRNVRICRFILGAIINVSLVWLVLLLISDFVSVPGFDNRGRGFIEIDLILLSLFANASTLCFFTIPSKLERSLDMAIAGIVTLDLLIMLLYRRFLHDRGGLGFATMLWLVASLSFGAVSDYLVEEAKNHEEIRLTGRVESRKTVYEFFCSSNASYSSLDNICASATAFP